MTLDEMLALLADNTSGAISAEDMRTVVTGLFENTDLKVNSADLAELVRDIMGATLAQGSNVTITVNDVANTITIAASGGDPDPATTPRFVFVATGSEARPGASGGLVLWIDLRDGAALLPDPTNMGTYDVRFIPSDDIPDSPPTILTTTLTSMVVGTPWEQALAAIGTPPIDWSTASGAWPAGITLDTDGTASGTPSGTGSGSVTVQAENSLGTDTQALSWTVAATATPPTITTTSLDPMIQGIAVDQEIEYTGSTVTGASITVGSLPAGLSIGVTSGVVSITGTPTGSGAYSFTVQVTNGGGSDTQAYSGSITPGDIDFNVMGNAAPGTASTVAGDGGGGLWLGNRFFTSRTGGIDITGVRVWEPVGFPDNLGQTITARAYLNNNTGAEVSGPTTFASTVQEEKLYSGARVEGTWTEFLFDAPVHLNPSTDPTNDLLTIAVLFGTGTHYPVVTGMSASDVESATSENVYLIDTGAVGRGINSVAPTIVNTYYGIDIIFEEV